MDAHTVIFDEKNDARTKSDELAMTYFHEGMVVKRSYMYCNSLDMTFFYDMNGQARYTYAGHFDRNDTIEQITIAFERAEALRAAMDETMAELLQELETKRTQERLSFAGNEEVEIDDSRDIDLD